MRSSYCTYHNSSRAVKTHELITAIFAKFFLSPYISLHEFNAILTVLRMLGCHLVPDFWQCEFSLCLTQKHEKKIACTLYCITRWPGGFPIQWQWKVVKKRKNNLRALSKKALSLICIFLRPKPAIKKYGKRHGVWNTRASHARRAYSCNLWQHWIIVSKGCAPNKALD